MEKRFLCNVQREEEVNEALAALDEVLNAIERHYHKGVCDFDAIVAHKGVATLLFTLGFGVTAREAMEANIASGRFDDLGTPENLWGSRQKI